MTINYEKATDALTVAPEGRLDSATSGELADFLQKHFTAEIRGLTVDLAGVDFISSKGLRVLVSVYKTLDGRSMEITGANASVREVFRLSGLLDALNVR